MLNLVHCVLFLIIIALYTSESLLVNINPRKFFQKIQSNRNDRSLLTTMFNRGIANASLAAAAAGSGNGGKKGCLSCTGKGAVNCATCRGTGIDRVNGNVFERWTCTKCKGFGYLPCPVCSASSKGLTPEQRQANPYYRI